jgi:hypothetical protein
MELDPFGLSVKDLAMRNVIVRSNSSGLVYTFACRPVFLLNELSLI